MNKIDKKEFIERSEKKHGKFYSYDLVNIKGTKIKVKIMCPKHGLFYQTPQEHMKGCGCKCCGYEKIGLSNCSSKEDVISLSKKVHGNDTFDYSLFEYKGMFVKSKFICKIHGVFEQTPNNNIHSQNGCDKCGGSFKNSLDSFIRKAEKIHGKKYNYSKFKYTNIFTPSIITCFKHGDFSQDPNNHLSGRGCPQCGIILSSDKKRYSKEEFVEKAVKAHGFNRYDYSTAVYKSSNKKVAIKCNKCFKVFMQTPSSHLTGTGCPVCNESRGEKSVRNWLSDNNICFMSQYVFSNLVGKNGNKFKFDFYIPSKNILIEFDGRQHFEPVCFKGISLEKAKTNFKKVTGNDALKNKYCSDNNIPLLRISYKNFKKIPEILSENVLKAAA
jgi:uncharacterized C2H2 Zn-finger protein